MCRGMTQTMTQTVGYWNANRCRNSSSGIGVQACLSAMTYEAILWMTLEYEEGDNSSSLMHQLNQSRGRVVPVDGFINERSCTTVSVE